MRESANRICGLPFCCWPEIDYTLISLLNNVLLASAQSSRERLLSVASVWYQSHAFVTFLTFISVVVNYAVGIKAVKKREKKGKS